MSVIFLHELRILLRDRQALGLLFVMPLALIVFLTLALQDVYQMKVGKALHLEVVAKGPCSKAEEICAQLVEELKTFPYQVSVVPRASAQAQLALVLPVDFTGAIDRLQKGQKLPENEQIELLFDPSLDQSFRALLEAHLRLALQSVLTARAQAGAPGDLPDVGHFAGLVQEHSRSGTDIPNPIQQTVPAWALFGMFFIVIPISSSMIRDRQLGIFKRLLSFPVSRADLLGGKILPFFLICFLQFSLMFAVGFFILPRFTHLELPLNFSFGLLWVVTGVCALAATSYGLMISCLTRTQEQAAAVGALSVVILAVVGGIMIPRFVMPGFMQGISQISPLFWGLEAYHDVILRHGSLSLVAPKLGVLLAFSGVCGAVSYLRFRWSEV